MQLPTQITCSCHHVKKSHNFVRATPKQTDGENCIDSKERQKTVTKRTHKQEFSRSSMSRKRLSSSPNRHVQLQMEMVETTHNLSSMWNSEGAPSV